MMKYTLSVYVILLRCDGDIYYRYAKNIEYGPLEPRYRVFPTVYPYSNLFFSCVRNLKYADSEFELVTRNEYTVRVTVYRYLHTVVF